MWEPKIDLETGLKMSLEYFRSEVTVGAGVRSKKLTRGAEALVSLSDVIWSRGSYGADFRRFRRIVQEYGSGFARGRDVRRFRDQLYSHSKTFVH